ncbi:MAG: hypothetical protein JXR80_11745 [Deltaproteobacteria bacterium]|nr:hypothetical protein [Deltaproteobacteria bacterium]
MAVDYDLICRRDALGPLLAAAFLIRKKCRVLLLPPLPVQAPEPHFLLPVLRGYPAALLSSLIALEKPPARFLSWQVDNTISFWPEAAARLQALAAARSSAGQGPPALAEFWQLLDSCMAQGLEMPVSSLNGIGRMLWLLLRNELLREHRRAGLADWLVGAGIAPAEQQLLRLLVPLLSLSRFADPPLLAYAYGLQTLVAPEAWLDLARLKARLYQFLIDHGAFQADEEWEPIFDGKWFIGVGNKDKVARRATLFLAEADPRSLRQEIRESRRRRDFKRQLRLDEPGYRLLSSVPASSGLSAGQALYHLDCRGADDICETELQVVAGAGVTAYRWQAVAPVAVEESSGVREPEGDWGWRPHLPAMMGGGFLPLRGSFCRFYQLGWHNLPGFGLGGLVYSAHQMAAWALKTELQR